MTDYRNLRKQFRLIIAYVFLQIILRVSQKGKYVRSLMEAKLTCVCVGGGGGGVYVHVLGVKPLHPWIRICRLQTSLFIGTLAR